MFFFFLFILLPTFLSISCIGFIWRRCIDVFYFIWHWNERNKVGIKDKPYLVSIICWVNHHFVLVNPVISFILYFFHKYMHYCARALIYSRILVVENVIKVISLDLIIQNSLPFLLFIHILISVVIHKVIKGNELLINLN